MNIDLVYIVFFSSSQIISSAIKLSEKLYLDNVRFSHTGLLVYSKNFEDDIILNNCISKEGWYVLESTLSGRLNDGIRNTCGKTVFGVQIRDFDRISKQYETIAVRDIKSTLGNRKCINEFIRFYGGYSYETNPINLLTVHHNAIESFHFFGKKNVFCSELVFLFLQSLHPFKRNPKKVSPNFLLLPKFDTFLGNLVYIKLGDEKSAYT